MAVRDPIRTRTESYGVDIPPVPVALFGKQYMARIDGVAKPKVDTFDANHGFAYDKVNVDGTTINLSLNIELSGNDACAMIDRIINRDFSVKPKEGGAS